MSTATAEWLREFYRPVEVIHGINVTRWRNEATHARIDTITDDFGNAVEMHLMAMVDWCISGLSIDYHF